MGGEEKEDNTGCGSGRLCKVVHPPINAASSSTTLEVLHRSGGLICLFVQSSKRGILKWCPHRLHKDDNPSWLLLQRAFRPEILGCVIQTVLRFPPLGAGWRISDRIRLLCSYLNSASRTDIGAELIERWRSDWCLLRQFFHFACDFKHLLSGNLCVAHKTDLGKLAAEQRSDLFHR